MKHTRGQGIDFSSGPVWKSIVAQAVPLTIAQLVHLLYNVVDRVYIGHMGEGSSMALTGIGLTFPVVTLIMAIAALFGTGGVPLFSIARGAGEKEKAGRVLGNSLSLILISSAVLMMLCYALRKPLLYAIGASEESYIFAREYLDIYLLGTAFSMIATGMNGYINAQGFPRIGMLSIVIGAAVNIILDPVFIFVFHMGVRGAAAATVISQALSSMWVLRFLLGKQALVPLLIKNMKPDKGTVLEITRLGTANFIMHGTNVFVQIACNTMLQTYGGDLYVGIMTVVNSVREVIQLPAAGVISGAEPVLSFNYGAKRYDRVRDGIRFDTVSLIIYTLIGWGLVYFFPKFWFGLFSDDPLMAETGAPMLKLYFFGFAFMALQMVGQSTFQGLGDARHAIFFSLLRKVVIVIPLTLILPGAGLGVRGVFLAEPISNIIGATACYLTMRRTVLKRLGQRET